MQTREAKIFGTGLSRTGTSTLCDIFSNWEISNLHFSESMLTDHTVVFPQKVLCDGPVPLYYQQLDKLYPGSKFILTIREKESWLKSMKWMFKHGKVIWYWRQPWDDYHLKIYGTKKYNETILSQAFDNYHHDIYEYFRDRPNDLLTIDFFNENPIPKIVDFLNLDPKLKTSTVPHSNKRRGTTLYQRLRYQAARIIYQN